MDFSQELLKYAKYMIAKSISDCPKAVPTICRLHTHSEQIPNIRLRNVLSIDMLIKMDALFIVILCSSKPSHDEPLIRNIGKLFQVISIFDRCTINFNE